MAKRKIVEVDEDVIKKMIAGDIQAPAGRNSLIDNDDSRNRPDYPDGPEDGSTAEIKEIEPAGDISEKAPVARKKKTRSGYPDLFLVQQKYSKPRQTTIILEDNIYSSVRKILKITEGLTLANFVNNVLRHHFNEYKEEIAILRRNFMSDLYNEE